MSKQRGCERQTTARALPRRRVAGAVGAFVLAMVATSGPAAPAAQESFTPARRIAGAVPDPPSPTTVGWVQEAIEVVVDEGGRPVSIETLNVTPGSRLLAPAVETWTFRPAAAGKTRQTARVLVAGIYRPPILLTGPTLGSPPVTVGVPSRAVPAALSTVVPEYPPRARGDGIAIVELLVSRDGRIESVLLVSGAPGFDMAALEAARKWTFRPALREGVSVPAYVYLVFGFRGPVV